MTGAGASSRSGAAAARGRRGGPRSSRPRVSAPVVLGVAFVLGIETMNDELRDEERVELNVCIGRGERRERDGSVRHMALQPQVLRCVFRRWVKK